jgi:Fe-S cluster biogenesis protein NfuA
MPTTQPVHVSAQITPNPNTLKFVVDQIILDYGSIDFATKESASTSPLAKRLFDILGVTSVFAGTNFVSVTKSNSIDWIDLAEPVTDTIRDAFITETVLIDPLIIEARDAAGTSDTTDIERRIREILETEIRPAVAMDGGDVLFHSYVDGIVTLHLQGACSTCPSSTMTLKLGIEGRLREEIPEIRDVVQL